MQDNHVSRGVYLMRTHPYILFSELDTPLLGYLDAGHLFFKDKISVILIQWCDYLHGKSADCLRCIEIVLKGNKCLVCLSSKREANCLHASSQDFTLELLSGDLVRENLDASSIVQCIFLRKYVMLSCAHPDISYFSTIARLYLVF